MGNKLVDVEYTLFNGQVIHVSVSKDVAAFLKKDDNRLKAQGRVDRRNLVPGGYVEGETELRLAPQGGGTVSKLLERERNAALQEAIATLTKTQQRVIRAYYFTGYTMREIAEHEGTSKSAVSHILKRARKNLKKLLADSQLFSDGQLFDDLCPLI
ncbi:MAG: sigma-70 family RNA polymerase sigma factor [Ruminococcaceae bacterium]|nr:sigma-70 family RNA polymerase sigma factor [Oscillospiraceae bacterium]